MQLADILAKFLQLLGLKKTEAGREDQMEQQARTIVAANTDSLEELKDSIGTLERKAKAKNKEYEAASGNIKRIVAGEIERIFAALDRTRDQEVIITRNIKQAELVLAKVRELKTARRQGVDEDTLDSLAIDLQETFEEFRAADKAARELERVRYEPVAEKPMDIDSRMAELEPNKESPDGLSEATLRRLKELASEE